MRILDLGCHDGYITNWLGRSAEQQLGVKLQIDGVELNPEAARVAAARAERDGIPGDYKVGAAEEAEWLFESGSYDAVLCFELIEHVPDVPRLLSVMEAMVKPGGRIYISTPDGTFGAGQNPHHLRVYRAVDLADLLRRRGELCDMEVGRDQVTSISYTPSEGRDQEEVAIYTGSNPQPWTPLDIEMSGLGGSETAAIRLADELSALGYLVTVYGECQPGGLAREVIYRHHETFDPTVKRHAVIASRAPGLFSVPINARKKLLWMHDTDYGPMLTEELTQHIDSIMVLSRWHERHVKEHYPFATEKLHRTRNGIYPDYFSRNGHGPERVQRAIYSSSPDRGLDLLLQWWPEVRFHVPDAELVYCYSSVYDAFARSDPRLARFREGLNKLTRQDGVRNLGSLPQQQLALEMARSMVWCAPSYFSPGNAKFFETFCIGAVEASAAGCSLVASDWGALPERVRSLVPASVKGRIGRLVGDDDQGKPDKDKFIEAIVEALTVDDRKLRPSGKALKLSWEGVAHDFQEAIEQ